MKTILLYKHTMIPKQQRALILQGGGALGAYEVGALHVLLKRLNYEDKKNGEKNRLLFDVIAGSSIGAINGAILVSQFLKNRSWNTAINELEKFWIDKNLGLASATPPSINFKLDRFDEKIDIERQIPASREEARRYYAVKHFSVYGAPKVYKLLKYRRDLRFFDKKNDWYVYSNRRLKQRIERFVDFPIATSFENNEPRLLVFAVDVAEGVMVTFDSYPKKDGSRRSEYGIRNMTEKKSQHIIRYPGITIEHVMASGTLPELYDYAEVPVDQTILQQKERIDTKNYKVKNNKIRYFWDSGIINNTPMRELLQSHHDFWIEQLENKDDKIPDLDIYIVNVHPPQINFEMIPKDYDGVKDRHNDIKYGDKYSLYDEKITNLLYDYYDFSNHLYNLINELLDSLPTKDHKNKFKIKLDKILTTNTITNIHATQKELQHMKYYDLLRYGFKLNKVKRIEHTNYINSIFYKGADFTYETVNKLIEEGKCDTWKSFLQDDLCNTKIFQNEDLSNILIEKLNLIIDTLRINNFEKNIINNELDNFINEINTNKMIKNQLKTTSKYASIMQLLKDFKQSLK